MSNLIVHSGGKIVDREAVFATETPEPNGKHYPVPHGVLVDEIQNQLTGYGYKVNKEEHCLAQNGNHWFGVFELSTERDDRTIVVGGRNSHDKRFSASVAMGNRVFVCDNLSFSGEVSLSRKHTRYVLRDLPGLTMRAVAKLTHAKHRQDQQFAAYQGTQLSDERARSLMIEGVKRKILPTTKIPEILKEWEQPSHEEFADQTVWRFFNAVTEVAKGWGHQTMIRRTQMLHGLCDLECGLSLSV